LIEGYLRSELHFTQAAPRTAVVERCGSATSSSASSARTATLRASNVPGVLLRADFVHRFHVAKTLDVHGLVAIFDQHCRDDEWREVLRLICADRRTIRWPDCRAIGHAGGFGGWDVHYAAELPLAIGCLSEVRSTSRLRWPGESVDRCCALLPGG